MSCLIGADATRGKKRAVLGFWIPPSLLIHPRGGERKNEELLLPLLRPVWCEATTQRCCCFCCFWDPVGALFSELLGRVCVGAGMSEGVAKGGEVFTLMARRGVKWEVSSQDRWGLLIPGPLTGRFHKANRTQGTGGKGEGEGARP